MRTHSALLDVPLDPATVRTAVEDPRAGAVVTFEGVVRNHDDGRGVVGIHYEGHPSAEQALRDVVEEFRDREGVHGIAVEHRVGDLVVGDLALSLAVAASHRSQAYACASDLVDRIKETLPVWKLQRFADGSEAWSRCP